MWCARRQHRADASRVRELMARYSEVELLVRVGEYERGSDKTADEAVAKIDRINAFLRQIDRRALQHGRGAPPIAGDRRMKKDDLARLHWIRKQREEKALKAVMARQGALQRAEAGVGRGERSPSADHAAAPRTRTRCACRTGRESAAAARDPQFPVGPRCRRGRAARAESGGAGRPPNSATPGAPSWRAPGLCSAAIAARRKSLPTSSSSETWGLRKRLTLAEANDDELHGRGFREPLGPPAGSRSEDA